MTDIPTTPLEIALAKSGAVAIRVTVANGTEYAIVRRGGEIRAFRTDSHEERQVDEISQLRILVNWPKESQ